MLKNFTAAVKKSWKSTGALHHLLAGNVVAAFVGRSPSNGDTLADVKDAAGYLTGVSDVQVVWAHIGELEQRPWRSFLHILQQDGLAKVDLWTRGHRVRTAFDARLDDEFFLEFDATLVWFVTFFKIVTSARLLGTFHPREVDVEPWKGFASQLHLVSAPKLAKAKRKARAHAPTAAAWCFDFAEVDADDADEAPDAGPESDGDSEANVGPDGGPEAVGGTEHHGGCTLHWLLKHA